MLQHGSQKEFQDNSSIGWIGQDCEKFRSFFLLRYISQEQLLIHQTPNTFELKMLQTFLNHPKQSKESVFAPEFQKPKYQVFIEARKIFNKEEFILKQEFIKYITNQKKIQKKNK